MSMYKEEAAGRQRGEEFAGSTAGTFVTERYMARRWRAMRRAAPRARATLRVRRYARCSRQRIRCTKRRTDRDRGEIEPRQCRAIAHAAEIAYRAADKVMVLRKRYSAYRYECNSREELLRAQHARQRYVVSIRCHRQAGSNAVEGHELPAPNDGVRCAAARRGAKREKAPYVVARYNMWAH